MSETEMQSTASGSENSSELGQGMESTPLSFVLEDGTLDEKWYERAPKNYKVPDGIKGAKNFWDVIKMAENAQRKLGYPPDALIPKPTQTWKQEQWDEFFAKIGRPEKPEAYGIEPKNKEAAEMYNQFAQKAHQLGLLPQQVKGVLEFYETITSNAVEQDKQLREQQVYEAQEALRKEYGAAYDKTMKQVERFFNLVCPSELKQNLVDKYGADPDFVRFLSAASNLVKEDVLEKSPVSQGDMSSIEQELLAIEKNPIYYDVRAAQQNKKEHDILVRKAHQLRTMLMK